MIVQLPVDAAYALDYYSILMVKAFEQLPVKDEQYAVLASLRSQIPNLKDVLDSPEYNQMLMTNYETFEAINKAHKDELTAREVQLVNHRRYEAKQALQKRFWPKSELREVKTKI